MQRCGKGLDFLVTFLINIDGLRNRIGLTAHRRYIVILKQTYLLTCCIAYIDHKACKLFLYGGEGLSRLVVYIIRFNSQCHLRIMYSLRQCFNILLYLEPFFSQLDNILIGKRQYKNLAFGINLLLSAKNLVDDACIGFVESVKLLLVLVKLFLDNILLRLKLGLIKSLDLFSGYLHLISVILHGFRCRRVFIGKRLHYTVEPFLLSRCPLRLS